MDKLRYELRLNGRAIGTYDDAMTALGRARLLVNVTPDCEPEIMDRRTGRAFEVGASVRWRDELAARMR